MSVKTGSIEGLKKKNWRGGEGSVIRKRTSITLS